jgi:RecB family exonuclease
VPRLSESELGGEAGPEAPVDLPIVDAVSFSALKTYLTCPRRYWAERVAGFGRFDDLLPAPPTAPGADDPLAFGSAVHEALEEAVEGRTPDAERLASIADAYGLGQQARERLGRAVEATLSSAAMAEARAVGTPRAEVSFAVALGASDGEVRLGGAIDLLALGGGRAVILDYKTGTSGGPDDIRERYGLQARCYALAALAAGAEEVAALYVRPEVAVEGDVETTRFGPFGPADVPSLEAEVLEIVGRIRDGDFSPIPSTFTCRDCPIPRALCPEALAEREESGTSPS